MKVENGELVDYTRFRRQLTQHIERLHSDDSLEKLVVTKQGKFEFVVVAVEDYEELVK